MKEVGRPLVFSLLELMLIFILDYHMRHQRITSLITLCLLATLVSSSLAGSRKMRHIPKGTWGGLHISMEVADGSATIEYDCARGTIDGPLKLDRGGRFSFGGTHAREHGGPIRSDEQPDSHPARYTGWTDGKTMKLTVTLLDTKETVGTFTLVHGNAGRVFKCR